MAREKDDGMAPPSVRAVCQRPIPQASWTNRPHGNIAMSLSDASRASFKSGRMAETEARRELFDDQHGNSTPERFDANETTSDDARSGRRFGRCRGLFTAPETFFNALPDDEIAAWEGGGDEQAYL